jgi:acyl-CoA oxidase
VHCFSVDIRNRETHDLLPGIKIWDMGTKVGNHEIDNGMAVFDNFVVPYDALLDKRSFISPDGKFKS